MGDTNHKRRNPERSDPNELEADLAYFDARLSLLKRSGNTAYQAAQRRAYEALGQVLGDSLEKLRRSKRRG